MADVKISALPSATALTGVEQIPAVQGGVTTKATPSQFTDAAITIANKPSVGMVAIANIVLNGLQTIDGVAGAANTLTLLTAQTAPAENGPWQQQVGAWTRPTWYASGNTVQAFQFISTFARLGNSLAGSVWRITTAGVITIDTTGTTWSQTKLANGALAGTVDVQVFSGSGTWTKPTTGTPITTRIIMLAGGGGGGSGAQVVVGTAASGGGGGGGGAYFDFTAPSSFYGVTETVTIGAGGTAGAATGGVGSGNPGGQGGNSIFGTVARLTAFGGGGGGPGAAGATSGGGGSGGSFSKGGTGTSSGGTAGGGGGATGGTGTAGNTPAQMFGGFAGSGSSALGVSSGGTGGSNYGGSGGASGGGITTTTAAAGGNGSFVPQNANATIAGGTVPGGVGTPGANSSLYAAGSSGAGGGGSAVGAGGVGGVGGQGSGGGGGGVGSAGGASGAGGIGGAGMIVVITTF